MMRRFIFFYLFLIAAVFGLLALPTQRAWARPAGPNQATQTPQEVVPVTVSTPEENGSILHVVQPGQALWSIAIAYEVTTAQLATLNGLDPETPTIYAGQTLLIRAAFTPTVSPTITQTSPPPTFTPRPTRRPSTPLPTVPTATPTPQPLLPKISFQLGSRQALGLGLVIFSGLGLLGLVIIALLGRRGSK